MTNPDRYDPGLNRTYAEMAGHYGTAILAARPRRPKDKAKVEVAVQIAQRWILARLRKRYVHNVIRKRWYVETPTGQVVALAIEESIVLSLLRRVLGSFFGLLRTNFVFTHTDGTVLGEFNRKFTILDRYVLDLSDDPQRYLDRRIALALGIMLDTAEGR